MICRDCGLDNLEGESHCPRCGRTLAVVNIGEPPRAKSKQRFRHLFYAYKRYRGFKWREMPPREQPDDSIYLLDYFSKTTILFAGFFLPSFMQFRLGRPRRGILILSVFLIGLLSFLFFLGFPRHNITLYIIATAQTWAIHDCIRFRNIVIHCLFVLITPLLFLGTFAADNSIWHFIMAKMHWHTVPLYHTDTPEIDPGMIVKVTPRQQYVPGELIMGKYYHINYIDRVIATGKHEFMMTDGIAYIDGKPANIQPLNTNSKFIWPKQKMEDGDVCVVPSFSRVFYPYNETLEQIYNYTQVSPVLQPDRITGKATVVFPIWRR